MKQLVKLNFAKFTLSVLMVAFMVMSSCEQDDPIPVEPLEDITGLNVTAGDAEVTLNWTAPAGNFSEYSLTYTPGGALVIIEGTETSHKIESLSNGVEYTFTIKTRNAQGDLSEGVSVVAIPNSVNGEVVTVVGDVIFTTQKDFEDFNSKTTFIDGSLVITGTVTDISALSNLDSVAGDLKIELTEVLDNTAGLEGVVRVGNTLVVWGNLVLNDLSGLANVETIGNDIALMSNEELTSLAGLEGVSTVGGDIYIGIQAWKDPVKQGENAKLGDFCSLKDMLVAGGLGGTFYADFNLFNPTKQDIVDGNCSGSGNTNSPKDVTNFAAVAGDQSVSVTWTKPDMDNLKEYELSYTPGDVITTIEATDEAYNATDLVNGTEYTFTLKSVSTSDQKSAGVVVVTTAGSDVVEGNVQLGTQADIDAFSSIVTTITGKLQIFGDDVVDLSPLSNITDVQGKFEILQTRSLTSLNGLSVITVGSNVYFQDNSVLANVDGLSTITSIGKDVVFLDNPLLTNLSGLQNVTTVEGSIYVGTKAWNDTADPSNPDFAEPNWKLKDFSGLSGLFTSGTHNGSYYAANNRINPTVSDITSGAAVAGTSVFDGNVKLGSQADINAFGAEYSAITNGKLQVFGDDVVDLRPLANLDDIGGKLEILQTAILTNLDGLNNIKITGSTVYLADNASMVDIGGLSGLTDIGKDLAILDCEVLTNLDGLASLLNVAGSIYIGTEAWNDPATDRGNGSLTDFCGLKPLLANGTLTGTYHATFNASNPTTTDIVNNCN